MICMMIKIRYIVLLTVISMPRKTGAGFMIIIKSFAMVKNLVNWTYMMYLLMTKAMISAQFNVVRIILEIVLT